MKFPIPILLGVAYGLSEVGLSLLKRSRDDSVDADDSSLRVLWITIVLAVTAGILVSSRAPGAAIANRAVFWTGCALFGLGLALRWYSIVYLGRFFTVNVAIHSGHEVIDTGPYRLIRHPSYTGALLAFLGLGFCFGNWLSILFLTVPIIGAFLWRIRIEESALTQALGNDYRAYMQRTKRLIPWVY